jgi:hypothetical protein
MNVFQRYWFPRAIFMSFSVLIVLVSCKSGPEINIWYGQKQTYGKSALSQKWINILGNVSATEDDSVALYYTLNGRPGRIYDGEAGKLNIGPHPSARLPRRLMFPGDFNVDIHMDNLHDGRNEVVITATDAAGNISEKVVLLDFVSNQTLALPYIIDWPQVDDPLQKLQIVDGFWTWNESGIRTLKFGYDRVLTVGDMGWSDYEASVLVTFHDIADTVNYPGSIRDGVGFGINARWLGHTDDPIADEQPKWGWKPSGAGAWYVFRQAGGQEKFGNQIFQLSAEPQEGDRIIDTSLRIDLGKQYWFKLNALTQDDGSLYRFKAWPADEDEPEQYMMQTMGLQGNLSHGALLIVAHYVDVTISTIAIKPARNL